MRKEERGRMIFSSAVRWGRSCGCWNMVAIPKCLVGCISPSVGNKIPPIRFNNVVFPLPEGALIP